MKNLSQISDNKDIITKEYLVAGYEPLLPATPLEPATKYLNGLKQWATIYTHPSTHPPSIIVQDTSNRFVTDAEKSTWNSKLNASSYTANDVLSKLLTVDGTETGLDADLLDGNHASAFSLSTHNHNGTYQPVDADLTAIAGLSGTSGFLKKTAANTWSLDTSPAGMGDMTTAVYGGSASGIVAKSDALKETRAGATEKVWVGTKVQYDAIVTKDAGTCYITTDETYGSYISLDETGHILASYMPSSVSAHIASTSNPHGVTKSQVGLGNVNNTADIDKPISLYVQNALDEKAALDHTHSTYAPINSPTFTGTVSGITAAMVGLGNVTNESKSTMFTSPTFTGTVSGITATMVGLGNVTNESKSTMFTSPTFTGTVSGITAAMVGLGNVTNESKSTMFTDPTFTGTVSGITATMVGLGNVTNESKSTMFTDPTFTGIAKATGNTSYTTSQLRNIFFNTAVPTSGDGSNGDIWIIYT